MLALAPALKFKHALRHCVGQRKLVDAVNVAFLLDARYLLNQIRAGKAGKILDKNPQQIGLQMVQYYHFV
ncbi:MAG: hypothetical protein IPM98_01300 [Lewinellaceae bacterium]|nr:hypothetical protein [Lewinellaceae bacterium]